MEVQEKLQLPVTLGNGDTLKLDALWCRDAHAVAQAVFAHGAGAGFTHVNMQRLAEEFAAQGIATLRFNFPFMQAGRRRVDIPADATAAIAAAWRWLASREPMPTFLAGHSFGGRMCSHAVQEHGLAVDGLIFCAFPLHAAKKPALSRAEHLPGIDLPMLFLSGTRDDLADPELLTELVGRLPRARLHWLETANHSYTILKRSRRNPLCVFEEMSIEARRFVDEHSATL